MGGAAVGERRLDVARGVEVGGLVADMPVSVEGVRVLRGERVYDATVDSGSSMIWYSPIVTE